jgi:hypothetical protein
MDLAPDFDEFIGSLTARGVEFVVVGASLAFLGRETILRNKRAAGRRKDLADIDALSDSRCLLNRHREEAPTHA